MNFQQWRGKQLEVTLYRIKSPKLTAPVRAARESTLLVPYIGNRPELVAIDACPLPDKYE